MNIKIIAKRNIIKADLEKLQRFIYEISIQNVRKSYATGKTPNITKNIIGALSCYLRATSEYKSTLRIFYVIQ